uniref:Fibronectin type-III domain-containing protein n=1 Tax=Hucho hucho TaxID=62062 RepID=A0A4W5KRE2_9TELE
YLCDLPKCVCDTIYVCVCVRACASLSLCVCASLSLSVCVCVSLSLSVCVCVSLSLCVCARLCVSLSLSLSVCVCVRLSVSLSGPRRVDQLQVVNVSSSQIWLRWLVQAAHHAAVSQVRLSLVPSDGSGARTALVNTSTMEYAFSSLLPGQMYTVDVLTQSGIRPDESPSTSHSAGPLQVWTLPMEERWGGRTRERPSVVGQGTPVSHTLGPSEPQDLGVAAEREHSEEMPR